MNLQKSKEPIIPEENQLQIDRIALELKRFEEITNNQQYEELEAVLKSGIKNINEVSEIRKSYTSPLDDLKAEIMAEEKRITKELVDEILRSKGLINGYLKAKLAEDVKKRSIPIKETTDFNELAAAESAGEISEMPIKGVRYSVTYEVINIKAIPDKYLMVNDSAIKRAIKDKQTIPGIKITKTPIRSGL